MNHVHSVTIFPSQLFRFIENRVERQTLILCQWKVKTIQWFGILTLAVLGNNLHCMLWMELNENIQTAIQIQDFYNLSAKILIGVS